MPMNRPTMGEAVVLRICSEKPFPNSLKEWPIAPIPTIKRYRKSMIPATLRRVVSWVLDIFIQAMGGAYGPNYYACCQS